MSNIKKIAFIDFWPKFDPEEWQLVSLIREICDVEITDVKHADYVFYSVFSQNHWFVKDECIKIFVTGEMITPDFNACDYAIGTDWMEYGDRYIRLPLYYLFEGFSEIAEKKHLCDPNEELKKKDGFCSITVSNANRAPIFAELFEELSKYKKVDSGGKWRNNVGGRISDKLAFDSSHKFTIACENCSHPGYTTEKIVQAMNAKCIPIYWGDPEVCKVFNPMSFVDVNKYSSIKEVVDEVIRIDSNAELYKEMLLTPAYADSKYNKEEQLKCLKEYLSNILLPPLQTSYRRNRVHWGNAYLKEKRIQTIMATPCYIARSVKTMLFKK